MSLHLHAVSVFRTIGYAAFTEIDGTTYINPDAPIGSVFAFDAEGNLYQCTNPNVATCDSWAQKRNSQTVQLFRDYWRSVNASNGSAYKQSIIDARRSYLVTP